MENGTEKCVRFERMTEQREACEGKAYLHPGMGNINDPIPTTESHHDNRG
ncbi:MAG: hypothetical protein N2V77_06720 [Canidatus Methanoxibalbensis ujae]|nr:hypothetical protein [Candidatus Methanoxibalbensis ujae]